MTKAAVRGMDATEQFLRQLCQSMQDTSRLLKKLLFIKIPEPDASRNLYVHK